MNDDRLCSSTRTLSVSCRPCPTRITDLVSITVACRGSSAAVRCARAEETLPSLRDGISSVRTRNQDASDPVQGGDPDTSHSRFGRRVHHAQSRRRRRWRGSGLRVRRAHQLCKSFARRCSKVHRSLTPLTAIDWRVRIGDRGESDGQTVLRFGRIIQIYSSLVSASLEVRFSPRHRDTYSRRMSNIAPCRNMTCRRRSRPRPCLSRPRRAKQHMPILRFRRRHLGQ